MAYRKHEKGVFGLKMNRFGSFGSIEPFVGDVAEVDWYLCGEEEG